MNAPLSIRRLRTPSAVLGTILLTGALLATAAPAQAVVEESYTVTGTVTVLDAEGVAAPADGAYVDLYQAPYEEGDLTFDETETAPDGTFVFEGVPDGDYEIDYYVPNDIAVLPLTVEFTVAGADHELATVVLERELEEQPEETLPELPAGTMTVSGTPEVGEVLTIASTGWPAGTTLSYQWGYSTGQSGGPLDGETSASLTVGADHIGYYLAAFVTGSKAGYADTTISLFHDVAVTTEQKPAAPAPVASSDDLGGYLVSKGSTPQPQDTAGLPAGSLNPAKGYEATVSWTSPDSFVDVYLYSSPVFVGTFPVIDGVAQISLSADLLSEVGAGGHTLVLLGQSSGSVGSVTVSIAAMLAATGADPAAAFAASGAFLLLGALSLIAARRIRSKA